jgi:hypothetical protein
MHPVNFVAKIDPPEIKERLEAILVCCAYEAELTKEITPPIPRPYPTATIGFEEIVDDAFTVWSSVKTTNRVTVLPDGIRINVKVQEGAWGLGHGAKFKALYRVFWR